MHNASEAFHRAVYENSPEERILLRFADGTFLSNEDIQVSGGVTITEAINYEEELTIGACLSSTFEATIINDHRLLSGYDFGECRVSLGVRTDTGRMEGTDGNCIAALNYGAERTATFTGHSQKPYLRMDGQATQGEQPGFPVQAILIDGHTVYCIGSAGQVWKATWLDASIWNDYSSTKWQNLADKTWDRMRGGTLYSGEIVPLNAYMTYKAKRLASAHRGIWYNADVLHEFTPDGNVKRFEYVPMGVFLMDIPKKRRTDYIEVQSYDRMTKFDEDASDFLATLNFPLTMKSLFQAIASYYNVPIATTGDFINSGITWTENPITDDNVTGKDILGWIAQAACTIARMTRGGELELAWFGSQSVTVPKNQYFDIDVTERDVGAIESLQIASPSDGIDVTVGGG